MFGRTQKPASRRNQRLRLEKLCSRNLFAGDVLGFENFQDGSLDGFEPAYSNAVFNGVDPASPMRRQLDDIQVAINLNSDDDADVPEFEREDVNQDDAVTALDALMVINGINELHESDSNDFDPRLDVNRDGNLSPIDALQVINRLYDDLNQNLNRPETVQYTTFQGERVTLYAYEGEHVRLLAKSPDLNNKDIAGLIEQIDQGYEFYSDSTRREPFDHGQSIGKTIIAQVDQTCGAGCGYLGVRGIEIDDQFFDEAIRAYSETGEPDHIFFYEMGRNFWFYQSKLEFNSFRADQSGRGSGDFMVNGFPILMERAFSEFMDVSFSGPTDGAGTPAFRDSMARWLDRYVADPGRNFETDFLDFEGSLYNDPATAAGNMGTMDYFAEIMLDVARDYGEIEFLQRFWAEISQRPDMTDLDSAISNLVDSASIAAGEDLHDRFINKYKWNTIDYARGFDDFDLSGRDEFAGGGLAGVYKPGSPFTEVAIQIVEQRVDETIDFEWGLGGPVSLIPRDHFSVDWSGQIYFPKAEEYTFNLFADDGVRLWIDGELVIEGWQPQRQELTGTFMASQSGPKSIRLEYFEQEGAATVRLGWQSSLFDGVIASEYLSPESSLSTDEPVRPNHFAAFRDGTWYLGDADGGLPEREVQFGLAGDTPLTGDYNGDGDLDLVVVRENNLTGLLDWYYDYSANGTLDASLQFGLLGDQPVAGDFNGDRLDDAAVVRPNTVTRGLDWYIDYDRRGFAAEYVRRFGSISDEATPGDFNGDGKTDFAYVRHQYGLNRLYMDTGNDGLYAERTAMFGFATDRIVIGDWDADGDDDIAAVRTSLDPENVDVLFDLNDGEDWHPEREIRYGFSGDDFLTF